MTSYIQTILLDVEHQITFELKDWYNIKLDERVCSVGYLEHTTELIMLRNVQSYFNWGKYHIPIHV